jgi:hypothetical protein
MSVDSRAHSICHERKMADVADIRATVSQEDEVKFCSAACRKAGAAAVRP